MNRPIAYLSILFAAMWPLLSMAQQNPYWQEPTKAQADSLKKELLIEKNDTVKMYLNRQLGLYNQEINRLTALMYFEYQLQLARETKQKIWEAEALSRIGYVSCLMQNYSGGLKFLLLAENLASKEGLEKEMWNPRLLSKKNSAFDARITILCDINNHLGLVHYFSGEYSKALAYHRKVKKLNEILNDNALASLSFLNMGESYFRLGQLDSAESVFNESINYSDKSGYKKYKGLTIYDMGKVYQMRDNDEEAKKYYRQSIKTNIETESPDFEGMGYQALADISKTNGDVDSLFYFSRQALKIYQTINDTLGLLAAYSSLSSYFDTMQQTDSAYHYLKKSTALKDSLNWTERVKNFQATGFSEQFKLQELEAAQIRTQTKIRTFSFTAGIVVLLLLSGVFYKNYRRQRKDKALIEKAFYDLKSTQSQLIQSEKMASLGELTAGIAHEIQNPLNFVNNFSEVSNEMIKEIQDERRKTKDERDVELENELLKDIEQNLEKILHHGKRADGIVKGMLQHSKSSSGVKEAIDINALCDEYLRLAYHGLRAKDKTFNAKFETDFDMSLPKVNVVPQEIGRVVLNLITNAFYVVNESSYAKASEDKSYEPTVIVSTKKEGNSVLISVKDNGNGIPDSIKEKIFQPFFTTKPTGQGTGLGLSLSYDIVKAHGGELLVNSTPGTETTFTVILSA